MGPAPDERTSAPADLFSNFKKVSGRRGFSLTGHEVVSVTYIGRGVARIRGLSGLQSEELVRFPGNVMGMAFNLDPGEAGIVMLGESSEISAGSEVRRVTHLGEELGGGSLSALPVIETEAQNLSSYIPTNPISITAGRIHRSPDLFRKGRLPAVDVGRSVNTPLFLCPGRLPNRRRVRMRAG